MNPLYVDTALAQAMPTHDNSHESRLIDSGYSSPSSEQPQQYNIFNNNNNNYNNIFIVPYQPTWTDINRPEALRQLFETGDPRTVNFQRLEEELWRRRFEHYQG